MKTEQQIRDKIELLEKERQKLESKRTDNFDGVLYLELTKIYAEVKVLVWCLE